MTEFGKALRKMRIDHQEFLKDMAEKLNLSVAYLSAVEIGKRKIPEDLVRKIANAYGLNAQEEEELNHLREISADEVHISMKNKTIEQRQAILSFAKALDSINDKELEKIMKIVNQERGESSRA